MSEGSVAFKRWYDSQPHGEWSARLAAEAAWNAALDEAVKPQSVSFQTATKILTLKISK
jgi:hypothetical protein